MATLVVSDLHLGTPAGNDLLRRADLRQTLVARLTQGDIDRLVLLGDAIELRHVAVTEALAAVADTLADIGSAIGEIVYVPGNHDWAVCGPWVTARREAGEPLQLVDGPQDPAAAGPLAERIASLLAPANVRFAYPGLYLRDDVYATHGHYVDAHTRTPTVERLFMGAMRRFVATTPEDQVDTVEHHEAILAPVYAWMHQVAQRETHSPTAVVAGTSVGVWNAVQKNPRRHPSALLARGAVGGGVLAARRVLRAEFDLDLSGAGLRRGGLHAIGVVAERLGVDAKHLLWGHSHRSGPWPGDDMAEWTAPTGTLIHNTGSWLWSETFVSDRPGGPYWPGTAIVVPDDPAQPPQLERLLGYRSHHDLRPG